jgi:hypothetical protein
MKNNVKTKEEVDKIIKKFKTIINSNIVRVEVFNKDFNEEKKHWSVSFRAKFKISDKYVDSESYDEGWAPIYLSKKFYNDVDDLGVDLFGKRPIWNNTYVVFTFSGNLRNNKETK